MEVTSPVKDKRIVHLISEGAAYVFEAGEGDSPTMLGIYIMEGSKAGATAAAVLAAHRLIPLNVTGYGRIIGRSIEDAQMLSKALMEKKIPNCQWQKIPGGTSYGKTRLQYRVYGLQRGGQY